MGKARDIREAVETGLASDPLVDAAGITVRNVSGNVALTGTVPSYPQYLEAAEVVGAAWLGHGVMAVIDQLEVTG